LHTHPQLEVTKVCDSKKTLILLGYFFDPERYKLNNAENMQRIIELTKDFNSLILILKQYVGRFAVFYKGHL
jgi:hypothetical protein